MEPEGSSPHSQVPAIPPYLSQINPVHTHTSHFLKIHLNIILLSTSGSPKRSLSFVFPPKLFIRLSPPPYALHAPPHLILLDFTTSTIFGKEYTSLNSSLGCFLYSPITSSHLRPNTRLNTLFPNTLSLRSSLNVSDQVPHPYKTTGKIIVLYIFICKIWIANWKAKDAAPNG